MAVLTKQQSGHLEMELLLTQRGWLWGEDRRWTHPDRKGSFTYQEAKRLMVSEHIETIVGEAK